MQHCKRVAAGVGVSTSNKLGWKFTDEQTSTTSYVPDFATRATVDPLTELELVVPKCPNSNDLVRSFVSEADDTADSTVGDEESIGSSDTESDGSKDSFAVSDEEASEETDMELSDNEAARRCAAFFEKLVSEHSKIA